jgi:hypothetical protein
VKNWKRYAIHTPHGAGAYLLFAMGRPWAGMAWTALMIAYQFIEDWRIDDKSYIDFRGYMIGFAVAWAVVEILGLIL